MTLTTCNTRLNISEGFPWRRWSGQKRLNSWARSDVFGLRPLMGTRWEEDPAGEPGGTEPSDTQTSDGQLGGGPLRQGSGRSSEGPFIRSELMRFNSRKIHFHRRFEPLQDRSRSPIGARARGSGVVSACAGFHVQLSVTPPPLIQLQSPNQTGCLSPFH